METVKIDMGDGDFAIVFKEMKHKTSNALQNLLRNAMSPADFIKLQAELQKESDVEKRKARLSQIPVEGDDVVTILNQVESWSFGEVTQTVIDNMPEAKYQILLAEVNKLYSQRPLATSK
jgi:hypothetical protein